MLEALLEFRGALDRVLLALPLLLHLARAHLQLLELAFDRLTALLRGCVLLFAQRRELDLQLHDAPIHLVDLGRQRVDLDAQLGGRLVDQVDRLVRQEAVRDVAVRERRCSDQRTVLDRHFVVDLVAFLEAAQDRDRVLHRGLADRDRLEAALERSVLLDVLAVLVERRRADAAQFAAREHRLEQVGRVHSPLRSARTDDRVQLVEEQDDRALRVSDLLQHALQAFLELAAVCRARDQRADVEGDHAPLAQRLGHVAVDDPLCEPLDDRRLADARLADQHGVVLGAPLSTWMTRRISSSRPITGSSLPCSAIAVRSRPKRSSGLCCSSGCGCCERPRAPGHQVTSRLLGSFVRLFREEISLRRAPARGLPR